MGDSISMLDILCFFAINKSMGIHYAGHNGYVKDCSSLGPDIVPGAQDVPKLMPKAVKGSKGKMSMLAGKKAAVKPHPELLLQDHALSALRAQHGFVLREAV